MSHTENKVPCKVAVTPCGWWLTFPTDPQAGLLFYTQSERDDFRTACDPRDNSGVFDYDPFEPEAFDPTAIDCCSIEYYVRARHFTSPGW